MRAVSKGVLYVAFLIASLAFNAAYGAEMASDVYVVDGRFESLEETEGGIVITLTVGGQKASGPVSASCKYYDHNGEEVSAGVFGQAFLGKPITVEILDRQGEVFSCYVMRFFYTN